MSERTGTRSRAGAQESRARGSEERETQVREGAVQNAGARARRGGGAHTDEYVVPVDPADEEQCEACQ
ncbi:MAG TPA: hypothetical protein VFQ96_01915 [Microbacteriaceae bacterium]|nr:hypothetical protein [Microbacteriaceae bacterium]